MANEGTPAPTYFEQLKHQTALPSVRIENDVWRLTLLPQENGKLVEMLHKPTGRNLLAAMTHADILKGTQEEIGLKGYAQDKPAAFTADVQGAVVKLAKTLDDGSIVERRISLKPDAPDKIFFESTLTNHGLAAMTGQFKAHPEFDTASKSDNCDVIAAYARGLG